MAVFKIERNKNYTNMSNYHFYDKRLSWKAKGILSNMLSLPDDWDYSLAGLVTLSSDGMSATRSAIKELEEYGYLMRRPVREKGKIVDWEYLIFEKPQDGEPQLENPQVVKRTQLNTNKSNTKESNTNKSNTKEKEYDENFEKLWKLLKSTQYDRKSAVTKKRKKELYEMGYERAAKAISVYLTVQNPQYYYKRDRFFNEIIDNYLDKEVSDFKQNDNSQSENPYANMKMGLTV